MDSLKRSLPLRLDEKNDSVNLSLSRKESSKQTENLIAWFGSPKI